jgi:hypothetical protein
MSIYVQDLSAALSRFANLHTHETDEERESDVYSESLLGTDSLLALVESLDAVLPIGSKFDPKLETLKNNLQALYLDCYRTKRVRTANNRNEWVSSMDWPMKPYFALLLTKPVGFQLRAEQLQSQAGELARALESDGEKGVSLFDIAMHLENDELAAKSWVKRFSDSKKLDVEPIGDCPNDGRKYLYRLSEILPILEKLFPMSKSENAKLQKAMQQRERSPKR